MVAMLRDFFLGLSIDKIELLCQGYVEKVQRSQQTSNPSTARSGLEQPQALPNNEHQANPVVKNQPEYEPSQESYPTPAGQ